MNAKQKNTFKYAKAIVLGDLSVAQEGTSEICSDPGIKLDTRFLSEEELANDVDIQKEFKRYLSSVIGALQMLEDG